MLASAAPTQRMVILEILEILDRQGCLLHKLRQNALLDRLSCPQRDLECTETKKGSYLKDLARVDHPGILPSDLQAARQMLPRILEQSHHWC